MCVKECPNWSHCCIGGTAPCRCKTTACRELLHEEKKIMCPPDLADTTTEGPNEGIIPSEAPKESAFYKLKARNWVFTINNYDDEVITLVKTWEQAKDFKCLMFGKEIAPTTGTPHLQGFICFETIKSGKQIAALRANNYWAPMRMKVENNAIYCSKDNTDVTVLGTIPMSQAAKGKCGVLGKEHGKKAANAWEELVKDVEEGMTKKEIERKYAKLVGQYGKGVDRLFESFKPKGDFDLLKIYGSYLPWQEVLLSEVAKGPDKRTIHWFWEHKGNAGKSDMCKHLAFQHGFQPLMNGTTKDLACAWKCGSVCFDYARDTECKELNYSVLEAIKNKYLFSSKYDSQTKQSESFKDVFVVCFANEPPDVRKLSADRWKIYRIEDGKAIPQILVGESVIDAIQV
nr:putative replication associated protein [Crucivirus sp.]